jgi:hypothetical protein
LAVQGFPLVDPPLEGLELLLDLLGLGGVGPEAGFGRGPLEKGYLFLLVSEVKDTPIGARRVPSDS